MAEETLYLSSLDSTRFEPVRECRIERLLTFDTGKVAAVARLFARDDRAALQPCLGHRDGDLVTAP